MRPTTALILIFALWCLAGYIDADVARDKARAGPVEPTVMQHTPGPWHWEADKVKGDPIGRVRYQVTALGKTVTRVYYSSYEGGPTNAEADARLIAEAPELLAMLRRVAALNNFRELNDLLPAVRAAIARAA